MRIDCSKAENFLKEWKRMCCTFEDCLQGCEMAKLCDEFLSPSDMVSIDGVEEIVQKWSDTNQEKTYIEDFIEKFPDAPINHKTLRPKAYPCDIYKDMNCNYENCEPFDCWYLPMKNQIYLIYCANDCKNIILVAEKDILSTNISIKNDGKRVIF